MLYSSQEFQHYGIGQLLHPQVSFGGFCWPLLCHYITCIAGSWTRTIGSTAAEFLWLQQLLKELQFSLPKVPCIFSNNINATYVCSNLVFHSHMKHVAIDCHFVHDLVAQTEFQIAHVPSSHQLADLLTETTFWTKPQFSKEQEYWCSLCLHHLEGAYWSTDLV